MYRYDHYTDKFIKAQPHTYRGVTLNDVMMYFDSLEGNEDAWTEFCSCLECRGWGLYHIRSATDKNVGAKYDELEIVRAISGLTEWQKHVQADSNINRDITIAIEALKAQLGTNLAEVGTDCISRQAAIDALKGCYCGGEDSCGEPWIYEDNAIKAVEQLPPIQPKRGKWVLVCDNNGMHFICNKCGAWRYHQEQNFCGECGAKMEGAEDE